MNQALQEQLLRQLRRSSKPLHTDALLNRMRLKRSRRAEALLCLEQLEKTGKIVKTAAGGYRISSGRVHTVTGRLVSLHKGFGFARLEEPEADCFLAGRDLAEALPGDRVSIRLGRPDARGLQGEVVRILEEGDHQYTGRLFIERKNQYAVEADSGFRYPLPVKRSSLGEAKEGDKIRFSVKRGREGDCLAMVRAVYGRSDCAKVCADAILDGRGIPVEFPREVRDRAAALYAAGISAADLESREDLRDWMILTIDGEDSKDLDDAVSLERLANGWLLGVHIADVSHYVRENSPLDEEAQNRGTSVYFADRVVPMLPEELSNGICSLNAGEDKLALSALMTLDESGAFRNLRLVSSVIRSNIRGVYREINDLFEDRAAPDVREKYRPAEEMLQDMRRLADQMRRQAQRRGILDLISVETRFVLDADGHPAQLLPRSTGEAEGMIEQFMIAANVAVARLARERKIPFVYRIHEHPDPEKLDLLRQTAELLQLPVPRGKEMTREVLQDLLEAAQETPYARLISERILRAMAKARYSATAKGHYGLALADYCHFTSPIRRYPDLAIHRILSSYLAGKSSQQLWERYETFVKESAELSSLYEVRAQTAERDCEACYKAEYMRGFLGEVFQGTIVSATSFGLYVELENTVTGLVRLEALPDPELRYDEIASLVDRHGRPIYTIGQPLTVRVEACEVSTGKIDFGLPDDSDTGVV